MKKLTKKKAKEIARDLIQVALSHTANSFEYETQKQYSEEDEELIMNYVLTDIKRISKLINRSVIW